MVKRTTTASTTMTAKASSIKHKKKLDKTTAVRTASPRWIQFDESWDSNEKQCLGMPPSMRNKLSAYILNAARTMEESVAESQATVRTQELGLPPILDRRRNGNNKATTPPTDKEDVEFVDYEFVDYELGQGGAAEATPEDQTREDEIPGDEAPAVDSANKEEKTTELRDEAEGNANVIKETEIIDQAVPEPTNDVVEQDVELAQVDNKVEGDAAIDRVIAEDANVEENNDKTATEGVVFLNANDMTALKGGESSDEDIFPPSPPHEIIIDKNTSIRSNIRDYHTEIDVLDELIQKYSQVATSPRFASSLPIPSTDDSNVPPVDAAPKSDVGSEVPPTPSDPISDEGDDSEPSETHLLHSFDQGNDSPPNETQLVNSSARGNETENNIPETESSIPSDSVATALAEVSDVDHPDVTPEATWSILAIVRDVMFRCTDKSTTCSFWGFENDDECEKDTLIETLSENTADSSEHSQLLMKQTFASTVNVGEPTFVPLEQLVVEEQAVEQSCHQVDVDDHAEDGIAKGKARRLVSIRKAFMKVFKREQKKQRKAREAPAPSQTTAVVRATKQKRGFKQWPRKGGLSSVHEPVFAESAYEISLEK